MFDPKFFLGIVTSNDDPDKRGRVRIRVMGIHTELTQPMDELGLGIKEDDLPLAQCMYPVTYSGTGGTCPPPSLLPGDWVIGVSLDGNSYQNLMVLGLAKAKFNAESLADGSINANDAFATTEKPASDQEMKESKDKAAEIVSNETVTGETKSVLEPLKGMSDNYETAKSTAESFLRGDTTSIPLESSSSQQALTATTTTATTSTQTSSTQPTAQEVAAEGEALLRGEIGGTDSSSSTAITTTDTSAKSSGSFMDTLTNGVKSALTPEWCSVLGIESSNGSTVPYNTNAFDTALSKGMGVYNVVKYIKQTKPEHYKKFTEDSALGEINVDTDNPSNIVTETFGEGYYEYCYNYFNKKTDKKSHILPTFAYNMGVGETEDYMMWYGNPYEKRCTYARMIQNMRNDGLETEADFLVSIIRTLNAKNNTKIAITDKNFKTYRYHQYLSPSSIINKKFSGLGAVVMPTLRSTVSQYYITLPDYSLENGFGHEHYGIDLLSDKIPVVSFADGIVKRIYDVKAEDCNAVVIQHACDVKTMYMHMYPVKVKEGQRVKAGEVIGTANGYGENGTNTTTPHLHFEIKHDTKLIDPLKFLKETLGFYIKELSTAAMYKRTISDDDYKKSDIYQKIKKDYRTDKNIAWSF